MGFTSYVDKVHSSIIALCTTAGATNNGQVGMQCALYVVCSCDISYTVGCRVSLGQSLLESECSYGKSCVIRLFYNAQLLLSSSFLLI